MEQIPNTMENIVKMMEQLRLTHHISDDCYYSCPMSGECCNGDEPKGCNCGASNHNTTVDEIIKKLRDYDEDYKCICGR